MAAAVESQALAVPGAVPGEVEVADDSPVARIHSVDLATQAVADVHTTGPRVVLDSLGIVAAEGLGAEVRHSVVAGAVDAVGPRTHARDPVLVVVRDKQGAASWVESEVRGLPVAGQHGAAAESRAPASRREQVGAPVAPRLVDL